MQIFLCLYFHIYFFANIFTFYSVQIDTVSLILYNKLINTAWLWGKSMKNVKFTEPFFIDFISVPTRTIPASISDEIK